jgi:serine/threonine protein kinase|uniref:Protein kinase domain-containing protein n=1 Tax=viral metagenome TaxID=1070528 RepID=A0A6C0BIC4_9ZZZZ
MITSGGHLMDEGMYGCIFTPSLRCKNKKDQPISKTPLLSKIISTESAELEYSIASIIRGIPLWKNYFAVATSICEPSLKQTDEDISKCEVITSKPLSAFRILSMTNGGSPLYQYRFQVDSFDMMNFFTHLIGAGALLSLFGIVHRDLHQGNVLVDNETVPRIIDFNLSIIKENVTEDELSHSHNVMLPQESPDATLVNAISLGYKRSQVIRSILLKKPIIKKIRSLLGVSYEKMLHSLDQFTSTSKSMQSGDTLLWFNTYWRTIDSWSIGVIILELLSTFSLWSGFALTITKHKAQLFPLLRRMCAVNPLQRVDCVQALYYLQPNHFIIRKYAKAWMDKVGTGNIQ